MQKPTRPQTFPEFKGQQTTAVKPFEIQVLSDNTVSVNEYSAILQNLEAREKMSILNLNSEIAVHYGSKIFLEMYFDQNLAPVSARIRYDFRWESTTAVKTNTAGEKTEIKLYPAEIDVITTQDIQPKLEQIKNDLISAKAEADQSIAIISQRVANGTMSQKDAAKRTKEITDSRDQYIIGMKKLQDNFSKFFAGGNLSARKQLRLYKLIGYTTKDTDENLAGVTITPKKETKETPYRLVQCIDSDLMLVDYCYKGIPAKILIPWTRPVFKFEIKDGVIEDEKLNGIKG